MTYSNNIADIEAVCKLLTSYSFDAESYQTGAVVADWLAEFSPVWVSHAITEALYQGRYKLISIDQILKLWQRRGQPIRHFNREFESIILGQTLLYSTGYGDGPESVSVRRPAPPTSSETTPQSIRLAQALESVHSDPLSAGLIQASPATSTGPSNPFDATSQPKAAEESAATAAADEVPEISIATASPTNTSRRDPAEADHPDIPNFRPVASEGSTSGSPVEVIQPFVPCRDESELHERLRAVVHGSQQV
ncbi:MAG: hypothetical protein WBA99_00915 [Nodosilinea sp.]